MSQRLTRSNVPDSRIRILNNNPFNPEGDYVLYWMIAARRTKWNFGLQRAVDWARELNKPLIVLEALRATYQWNSDRIHAFIIQGMADNWRDFSGTGVSYYPYLEPTAGDERGMLRELSRAASLVVSDDFPCFFLPRMITAAARMINTRFELIDSNGLYPMRDTDRVFTRAFDFRRHLQKNLLSHLVHRPLSNPLAGAPLTRLKSIPIEILRRWPAADPVALAQNLADLKKFPINHAVTISATVGGSSAAQQQAQSFLDQRLAEYKDARNQPEKMMTSRLSPYLHFGHLSAHQLFDGIAQQTNWQPDHVAAKVTGQANGWWGTNEAVESFLDELVTWRELGYNRCANTDDFDQYESLPAWAQKTLAEHESDRRPVLYSSQEFETAQTHDSLWNAAQTQLVTTGVIHNYLRMLWGKKILEWSPSPRAALATMIELNNKYALDGRNPNSYSGIFWVLGRYDRAWGEREIFGKIRFMSSDNTARKVKVKNYIQQFQPR